MQRAFISDLRPLTANKGQYVFANFNGSVQLWDPAARQVIRPWREHTDWVWKVEPITEHVFASSSQDGCVKVYDTRRAKSLHTINLDYGPVTALLSLKPHILAAGACPEKEAAHLKSAQIRMYDLRKTGD